MNLEENIFEHALELPSAPARAEYLRVACADDQAMLERLQGLLRAHDRAGKFLEHDPSEANAPAYAIRAAACGIAENMEPVLIQKAGERIGPYKLLEKIGEGGFGEVWMAEQKEPVKRRVALKIIKLGMDTRAVIARFEAERQALAMMDHPNIAKVLDAGATESGRPFFVMELVRGVHLTEYCGKNRLSVSERIELFMQVCRAIQHAHQKGVIHRDIKPSNILVTLHDGVPVPKVIDFGIAKATQQELSEKTVFTQFRQFIGTPAYISPEQAEMSGLEVDTRSDIYSLGVLLYELLTGTTPFDSKELILSGLDGMRKIIQQREPVRPSTRLRQTASQAFTSSTSRATDELSLSTDLDWIVMKCLEKDRGRRYETANGLVNDLQRHLDNEPVVARPPSASYRLRKFVRRNRVVFSAGVAVAVVLILGVVASTWQAFRATQLQKQAQAGEYAAKMRLAQAAWEENQIGQVRRLLQKTADYPDRGFEWYYWQQQAHQELRTLRGHLDQVLAVCISPDGRRIVTGSKDQTAKVWDAESGKELLTLKGHLAPVSCVAFSPDGRRIVTGSLDSTAIVWDAMSCEKLKILKDHRSDIWGVAFSPDGLRIATASTDRTAIIWDTASGKPILSLQGHKMDVASVTFSPDGRLVATASDDHTSKIWDSSTGKVIHTLTGHENRVYGVAFSADGQRIVTGSDDYTARIWDVNTAKELFRLIGHRDRVYSVAFSPDGERVVSVSRDQTVRIWEAGTGRLLRVLRGHEADIWGAAFSHDGRWIVTGSFDRTAKVWDADPDKEPLTFRRHRGEVVCAAFSGDGGRIITGGEDQTAYVWDAGSGKPLLTLKGHSAPVTGAAFSPDDHLIATASGDQTIKLWDVADGRELFPLTGHSGPIKSLAFSSDGKRIVTASSDQTARVWDISARRCLVILRGHTDGVISAAFSPDGRRIVTGSNDSTARVWDAADGKLLLTFRGHSSDSGVPSAHFSPDGKRILTSSSDQTAMVWDSFTGTNLLSLIGHADVVYWADFSPDGRRIVTGSFDQTARLWDAASGEELLTLKGHVASVGMVAFSPNGRRIVTTSAGDDGTAKVWRAASAEDVALWRKEEQDASDRMALALREKASVAEHERSLVLQDPGVIKQWFMLAPINYTNKTGSEALDGEQIPDEAHVRPEPAKWRALLVSDPYIDFDVINRVNARGYVAYAVTYIRSDSRQTNLSLKVGSDDEAKIYLNEKEIYRRDLPRTYVRDQGEVTGVELKPGLNVLVLKAVIELAENNDWRCSVRITDAAGQPVKGTHTTITPASDEDPGAIHQWLVLAPIRFTGTNGLQALNQEQLFDEPNLQPKAGQRSRAGGTEFVWQKVQREDYGLDFNELSNQTNTDWCVAYAVSYIECVTNHADLKMKVGSDDQCKVFLNGKEIYRYERPRACTPDQDEVTGVELKEGVNVLVFKVVNEMLGWQGSIRFTEPDGQPVKGIRVTLAPR